jgi:hypothetical protein
MKKSTCYRILGFISAALSGCSLVAAYWFYSILFMFTWVIFFELSDITEKI